MTTPSPGPLDGDGRYDVMRDPRLWGDCAVERSWAWPTVPAPHEHRRTERYVRGGDLLCRVMDANAEVVRLERLALLADCVRAAFLEKWASGQQVRGEFSSGIARAAKPGQSLGVERSRVQREERT